MADSQPSRNALGLPGSEAANLPGLAQPPLPHLKLLVLAWHAGWHGRLPHLPRLCVLCRGRQVALEIASAIAYLHSRTQPIMHQDIKVGACRSLGVRSAWSRRIPQLFLS